MTGGARTTGRHDAAAVLLLALLGLQAWPALRLKTPVFDEPAHIGSGFSYLETRQFKINLQHPPLLKEIAAVPLVLAGIRWPIPDEEWRANGDDPDPLLQWKVGGQVLYENDPDKVLFLARLPFFGLLLLFGWAIYAWGRAMLGPGAALAALGLFALDPSIVAHGILVCTDVGFGLFALLFVWALWRFLNHRSLQRLLLAGLALGGAMGAKFTGVLLLPLALALLLMAVRWIPAAVPARASGPVDPYASAGAGPRAFWCVWLLAGLAAIASVVIYLLYFCPSNPFLYLTGIERVNADHDATYWPYMAGRFQPRFWSYYVVAYLLKEPLPAILLALVGVFVMAGKGRRVAVMDRAFILGPPIALFAFYSVVSHNLGFRYVLPALPFLHLAGGVGARALWESGAIWKRGALGILAAWLGLNAWGISPDHLSYFNETACLWTEPSRIGLDAGSACGTRWLDDSNVDWGQGLKQLKTWLDQNAPGRRIGLAYFGTGQPAAYGIDFDRITGRDLERGLPPGLHAISAHLVARALGTLGEKFGSGPGNWLLHTAPKAVVGHAYYIYEIPPAGS
ncbi:MAG TPA: glycosyltransferase family 39 protein [Patescibacteria group bacterium]|nr:glycosyltransferase family 39 protein [Patescibacteria group bacterium]